MPLTLKERKFIDYYMGEANGNATKAAKLAGYKSNGQSLRALASENLTKLDIRAEINRIYAENMMPAEEVLARLTDQGRGPGPYIEALGNGLIVNTEALLEDGMAHIVKSTRYSDKGQPIIEFHDAQAALALLGKKHKLFTEKLEVDVVSNLSDAQLDAILLDAATSTGPTNAGAAGDTGEPAAGGAQSDGGPGEARNREEDTGEGGGADEQQDE